MYIGIMKNRGLRVPDADALLFAMAACGLVRPAFVSVTADMRAFDGMLVEWFYSGNWLHVGEEMCGDEEFPGPGRNWTVPDEQ